MTNDRRDEVGVDDPPRLDGDGLKFGYTSMATTGGGLTWTVSCEVDGQVVQGIASTATEAWDRAIELAFEVKRINRAATGPEGGHAPS